VRRYTDWSKARVTNNRFLSFLDISLCHTHLPAMQLEGWNYNELNSDCLYADTKTKEYAFLLFVDAFCLKFLEQKSLLQFFLNCETSVCFLVLPFHSKKKDILWPWCLVSSVFIEVCFCTEKKGRHMGLTKIESCSCHNFIPKKDSLFRNTSRVTSLSKTSASNWKISRTNWSDCIFYKFELIVLSAFSKTHRNISVLFPSKCPFLVIFLVRVILMVFVNHVQKF